MKRYICTRCDYIGKRRLVTPGSLLIEIILWCFWLIPGLIYSIWRGTQRHYICPDCGSKHMKPIRK